MMSSELHDSTKKLEGDLCLSNSQLLEPLVGFDFLSVFWFFQVDPSTGEAEEDGVEDEYQLEDLEVVVADYVLKVPVSNFRNAWESMGPDCERVEEYGIGQRESLAEGVNAVINLLGLQPCEVGLWGL